MSGFNKVDMAKSCIRHGCRKCVDPADMGGSSHLHLSVEDPRTWSETSTLEQLRPAGRHQLKILVAEDLDAGRS